MEKRNKGIEKRIKKLLIITIGTLFYAVGISRFLDPNGLAPGGVVGLSIIGSHTFGGATGTWYFLMNIPIILLGWWKFGGSFILYSFYAVTLNSVFTNLLGKGLPITDNLLLAAIAGSILNGIGIGLVLKTGATTGGMDIVIKTLRKKYPFLKTSTLFLAIDLSIVTLSGFVFRDFNAAMYALIAVICTGRVLDYVLYGSDEAKLIYIISDQPQKLLNRMLEELEIGATILNGKGAYSKKEKNIIFCVLRKQNVPKLEELVKQEDQEAFMIISSANEIYGEGYKDIQLERI